MSEAWQPVWEQALPPGAEDTPANPGPDRQGEDNSFWRNLGIGWLQNSGVALRAEEQIDRAAAFEGAFRPAPVEGYTPFSDPALLRGFEDDLAMSAGSRSPRDVAISVRVGTRIEPVKCRCRCALGRVTRSRIRRVCQASAPDGLSRGGQHPTLERHGDRARPVVHAELGEDA